MTEAQLVRQIKKHLKDTYGCECVKYHGSPYGELGVADLLCAWKPQNSPYARFLALEVKTPIGRLSAHQEAWLIRWAHSGAITGVVRSVEDVDRLLLRNQSVDKFT